MESLFIHLLRILEVEGQGLLHELDRQYSFSVFRYR